MQPSNFWTTVWAALVLALVQVVIAWLRELTARSRDRAINVKVEQVRHLANSLSEKLAASSLAQGTAEGHAAGLIEGRQETQK